MAKIILEDTGLIMIGAWNIAILTPNWFRKQFPQIVKEKDIPMEMAVNSISEFRFTVSHITIHVSNNRLMLSPKKKSKDYLEKITNLAVGIVKILPHTPVSAIGHNISYQLEDEKTKFFSQDLTEKQEAFFDDKLKPGTLYSQEMKHSFSFENYILNLVYHLGKKNNINFNFHYYVKNNSKVELFLSEFEKNILYSKEIFNRLVE